jgi:hypothetical protein
MPPPWSLSAASLIARMSVLFSLGLLAMEPVLVTIPELQGVLEELSQREPIFHKPEFGTNRKDFEAMTSDEFWEVGASGRRYSREFVLNAIESRVREPDEDRWQTRDFHCLQIAQDNFLLTYTLLQGTRLTRRSTIWRRTPGGWKILFHQGTAVE